MTAKEFNKKYKLSFKGIDSPFEFSNSTSNFVNIAGKPKKLVLEIFKRFFKSWPSVLFLIVFLFVLITSIVVTATSSYDVNKSISQTNGLYLIGEKLGEHNPTSSPFTNSLPTKFVEYSRSSSVINDNELVKYFQAYQKEYDGFFWKLFQDQKIQIVNPIKDSNGNIVNQERLINFYKLYKLNSIFIIFKQSQIQSGQSFEAYTNLYNQASNLNPQLNLNTFLGTTQKGVDVWTQAWVGTWKAVRLAIIIATIQTIIGVAIGSYLGFHVGTAIDTVIMRLIDIFSAPPTLVWLLLFVSLFGTTDLTLGFSMIFVGWVGSVGRTRLFIITVKDSEFITASKSVGASKARLIYKHALPNIIGKIATGFVASIPSIILSISSLAFLGFFKADEDINLGQIISSASAEAGSNVWILLLPSLILLSISVSLHFIALGVHDALDPKVIKTK